MIEDYFTCEDKNHLRVVGISKADIDFQIKDQKYLVLSSFFPLSLKVFGINFYDPNGPLIKLPKHIPYTLISEPEKELGGDIIFQWRIIWNGVTKKTIDIYDDIIYVNYNEFIFQKRSFNSITQ